LVAVLDGVANGGGDTEVLDLDKDEAVGLLSLSEDETLAAFRTGEGVEVEAAFLDRARDAAVGAYSPADGVFGRLVIGDLARDDIGVLDREGLFIVAAGGFGTGVLRAEGVATD
jgi:hypothetical protein